MNQIAAAHAAAARPLIFVYIFSHVLEEFVPIWHPKTMADAEASSAQLTKAGVKNWVVNQSKGEFLKTVQGLTDIVEKKFA